MVSSSPALILLQNSFPEKELSFKTCYRSLICNLRPARAQLHAKKRRKEETAPEVAEDLRRLSFIADQDTNEDLQDRLAMDQFKDVHLELNLKINIIERRPRTT